MDSGNSSSMKSSSGGGGGGLDQEEYNSRTNQSISTIFNHNNTIAHHVSSNIAVPTQLDTFIANYFNTSWSTTTTQQLQDGFGPSPPIFLQQNLGTVSNTNITSPICSVDPTDKKTGLNPKKRRRISKRPPTTVLTTDTSNFRAMVQEFTGNPSPPFTGLSSSSLFPRSRLDLFKPFPQTTSNHHYLNMNTQSITNPFLNHKSLSNPLMNQSVLCDEKSRPLSLRSSSSGFGNMDVGTNFEGLHNIIVSSSSSENVNDVLRSINGEKI